MIFLLQTLPQLNDYFLDQTSNLSSIEEHWTTNFRIYKSFLYKLPLLPQLGPPRLTHAHLLSQPFNLSSTSITNNYIDAGSPSHITFLLVYFVY